ncbi:hypothetical protein ABFS83_14G273500 [Erythranthe nasuta]
MMMNSGSTQSEEFIIDDSNSEYSISSFFNPSSSSSSNTHQNTTSFHPHHNDHLFWSAGLTPHQTTTFPLPPPPDSDSLRAVRKTPKKRSRVSNRNPTTVLTTDATNFRQMVQQFTGIPATPLSGGPPRSLDLFSLRPGYQYLDTLYGPFHPLKPSAHKVSSSSSLLNPTTIDSVVTSANIVSTTATTGDPAASNSNNNSNNYPPSISSDNNRFNLLIHSIIDPLQLGGNSSTGFGGGAALISGFQSPSAASQLKDNDNI